jgi:4-hydroxyphenylpyruvate dioxygenase-like putative hemolysin
VATSRSIRSAVFGGFVLVVLAASGCRGEERLTKGAYEERVRAEYSGVQEAFASTRGTSGESLAGKVRDAQRALRNAAEALEAAEPPEQVEEENEELVEGMRAYAKQLDAIADAASAGNDALIGGFSTSLATNRAVEQMAEAAEEMKFKGYDLGAIAEE